MSSTPPKRATKRLVALFERELREFDAEVQPPEAKKKQPVSIDLDEQVVDFASETRTSGETPEQMIVELKTLLAKVAPEVPGSQRSKLVARVTGRAIDAYFKG